MELRNCRLSVAILCFLLSMSGCFRTEVEKTPLIAEDTVRQEPAIQVEAKADTVYEQMLQARAAHIDSFFTRYYKNNLFNGTVLFAEKGKIIYENSFGYADFKEKDTLTTSTPFQLASVSKPLTALAVLMLKEKKWLSLEDSVQKFLPDFPYPGITIRMLLTHKSGLPNYMYFADEYWVDRKTPITNDDVLCLMKTYHPDVYYLPDVHYNYSNTNYALLASIIEKVTSLPFKTFMERFMFAPLGMTNTVIYDYFNEEAIANAAVGYSRRRVKADNTYLNGVVGDKGVYSTVDDLFKLDQALYNGTLLSKKTLNEAFFPYHERLYDNDNYGLGWRINTQPDCSKIVFHSGWWKGFRTHFIRVLDKEQTIIVLSNTDWSKFVSTRNLLDLMEYPNTEDTLLQ